MNALILAAGLGTRLKPLTDNIPKALVKVNGIPLIQHLLDRLNNDGFDNVVINVHHFAEQIVNYINNIKTKGVNIVISDESKLLLDTGGAIKKAARLIDLKNALLVHNVDIFHNISLKDFYEKYANYADAVLIVSKRMTSRYLLFNENNRLVGWINMKTGEIRSPFEEVKNNPAAFNRYAFSGIHLLNKDIVEYMDNWGERFSVIDFYLDACVNYSIVGIVYPDLNLLDVGKIDSLKIAERFLIEDTIK